MAMKRYRGVDGVAREVTKRYRGVDGVARAIVKGYRGVDGVARQYFSSGVEWRKYSCDVSSSTYYVYTQDDSDFSLYASETEQTASTWGYPGYLFSPHSGYVMKGVREEYGPASGTTGTYYASGGTVCMKHICRYDPASGKYYKSDWIRRATKDGPYYESIYSKGSTEYGSMRAPEGELPEAGTLVEGDVASDYCVLKVGGTYYYYEKV